MVRTSLLCPLYKGATQRAPGAWLAASLFAAGALARTPAAFAGIFSGVAATALKYIFSRERPSQTSDPNRWFTGHGGSFPSAEVTTTSSLVAPFALELLPIYDGIARMKTWGHWQSDALAGFAPGTAARYLLHRPGSPLILSVLPHGFAIGFRKEL
jgi:undecaprenyl-diphosphatase